VGGKGRTQKRIGVVAGFWPALLGWGCHGAIACIVRPSSHTGRLELPRWVLLALLSVLLLTSIAALFGALIVAYRYRKRFEPGEGCGVFLINVSSAIGLVFSAVRLFVAP